MTKSTPTIPLSGKSLSGPSLVRWLSVIVAARLRTLVRGNEFFLIPLALVIGAVVGAAVAYMSQSFDDAEAEILVVVDSAADRKVVGMLTEAYAARRYAEELDQATRGLTGATYSVFRSYGITR